MAQKRDAVREWKKLLNLKQDTSPIRFALSGDGSSAATADIDGRPGWIWVRYDEEQNKVSQVRGWRVIGIPQDVPLIIGKEFPTDRYVQVLGINRPLYDMFITDPELISWAVAPHGHTHHAVLGSDPAYIDVRNILNGRVRAENPPSMSVQVESVAFEYQDTRALFGGGGVDMTYYVPTTANYHGYVVVTLDTIEQGLRTVRGPTNPTAAPATLPDVPIWNIPLGAVLLYNGMTEVVETDVHDMRILFEPVGKYQAHQNFVRYMYYNDLMWTRHLAGEI